MPERGQQAFADSYVPQLASAMGIGNDAPVALHRANAAALQAVLLRAMARQYPGETLNYMGRAYAAIGLVAKGTDLRAEALKLYQAQVLGFYDPCARQMALVEGAEPQSQAEVLRHELAHALQDRRYPLQPRIDAAAPDDDEALALQAVIEGQAMVAMNLELATKAAAGTAEAGAGAGAAANDAQRKAVRDQFSGTDVSLSGDEVGVLSNADARRVAGAVQTQLGNLSAGAQGVAKASKKAASAAQAEVGKLYDKAADSLEEALAAVKAAVGAEADEDSHATLTREADPIPYLQAQLTFPYDEGRAFIEKLAEASSFAAVVHQTLSNPPRSTREVLHPETYGRPLPAVGPLPIEQEAQAKLLWRTTVGELNVRTLLRGCPQGARLAAQLQGDRLVLVTVGGEERVAWKTRWHTAADASAFARCMADISPMMAAQVYAKEVGLLGCGKEARCAPGRLAGALFQ